MEAARGDVHWKQGDVDSIQCIDSNRSETVKPEMCGAGCCIYEGEYHKNGTSDARNVEGSNSMPYCGTQQECDELRQSSQTDQPYLIVIFLVCVLLPHACQHLVCPDRQRAIRVRKKLDAEFPPFKFPPKVDDTPDDLELQSSGDEVCCICLDGFEGTTVRKLGCSHVLHQNCFDSWCLHLSVPNRKKGSDQNKPEESLWVCPLCKRPAMREMKQPGPSIILVSGVEPQPSDNNGAVSEELPEFRASSSTERTGVWYRRLCCLFHSMESFLKNAIERVKALQFRLRPQRVNVIGMQVSHVPMRSPVRHIHRIDVREAGVGEAMFIGVLAGEN